MNPEITIEQGKLKGSVKTNFDGKSFYSFEGIPYAKPPLGNLRFKAPQAPEKWNGVFDATKQGSGSYARNVFQPELIEGSENCLVLNVYTKRIPNEVDFDPDLPVMFWIHGGGFIVGSSSTKEYGPEHLLNEDIVLVTFNYRLGLLGFLALEDQSLEVHGNAAMKDMIQALKWVQKNIRRFGGNENNVTIFGQSAGAASVQYLVLSPLAEGLFHRAIAQSGSAVHPWALAGSNSKQVATALGLDNADDKTILEELMKKTTEEIFAIQGKCAELEDSTSLRLFAPKVDSNSPLPFLPDLPRNLIITGRFNQVPYMTGYTTAEGMFFDFPIVKNYEFEISVPWILGYQKGTAKYEKARDKIIHFYYGGKQTSSKAIKYQVLTDTQFLHGIYFTVVNQFHQSKAPTYLYRMSVESNLNLFKAFLKLEEPGVCHGDDLGYLFRTAVTPEIKADSLEEITMRRFVRLWTNFAKYGNPTPFNQEDKLLNVLWEPVTDTNVQFLDIGKELTTHSQPEAKRIAFWTEMLENSPAGAQIRKIKKY